jgi:hypothetical protein
MNPEPPVFMNPEYRQRNELLLNMSAVDILLAGYV